MGRSHTLGPSYGSLGASVGWLWGGPIDSISLWVFGVSMGQIGADPISSIPPYGSLGFSMGRIGADPISSIPPYRFWAS